MKILVTGAAGFIGFHTAQKLLARGDTVVGLDSVNDYYDVRLKEARLAQLREHKAFAFQKLDLADRRGIETVFTTHRPERVIHLAAQAGVRYASTSSVYGANEAMPFSVHQSVDHPVSLYAATKKANELMAHSYAHLYRLPTTGLRFFTVYGPWGRPDMAMFLFANRILAGKPIDVFNHGHHSRDFTYVDDIVEGVVRAMDRIATPNPAWSGKAPDPGTSASPYRLYNIGNNKPVELMYLISCIETALGRQAEKNFLPLQPGDVPDTYADIDALVEDVGFRPETPIEVGVDRFIAWYKGYYGHN